MGSLVTARLAHIDSDRACLAIDVAASTLPSVVTVLTSGPGGAGNGTGQVICEGGYILINDHVVSTAIAAPGGEIAALRGR